MWQGAPGALDNRDPTRVMAAVRAAGLTHIDYQLITHFHGDHIGGLPEVARRLREWLDASRSDLRVQRQMLAAATEHGLAVVPRGSGTSVEKGSSLGSGIRNCDCGRCGGGGPTPTRITGGFWMGFSGLRGRARPGAICTSATATSRR